MTFLKVGGFETGDLSEAVATAGLISVAASIPRTGAYALLFNAAWGTGSPQWVASADFNGLANTGVPAELGRTAATYYVLHLYAVALPSVDIDIAAVISAAGSAVVKVHLTSAGVLTLTGATNSATIATLTTGAYYRIELKVVSNGTSECKVNGGTVQTCTANNVTQDRLRLGTFASVNGSANLRWDDWAISDSGYIGAGQVNILKPNATGTYTAWTDGAGTAPTNVAEVPHNSDTGYITSSTATQAETENLDSAATGGVSGTIGTVMSVVIVRDEAGVSSLNIRTRSNATDQDTTGVDPGATYTLLGKMNDTDPATGVAWTSSGLDALQVGVLNNNAVAVRCTAIYAMVWSTGVTPAPDATSIMRRAFAPQLTGPRALIPQQPGDLTAQNFSYREPLPGAHTVFHPTPQMLGPRAFRPQSQYDPRVEVAPVAYQPPLPGAETPYHPTPHMLGPRGFRPQRYDPYTPDGTTILNTVVLPAGDEGPVSIPLWTKGLYKPMRYAPLRYAPLRFKPPRYRKPF